MQGTHAIEWEPSRESGSSSGGAGRQRSRIGISKPLRPKGARCGAELDESRNGGDAGGGGRDSERRRRDGRGSASWGKGRRPVRNPEVVKDGADGGRIGEEGDDPYLPLRGRAEEGKDLVDASEEASPGDAIEPFDSGAVVPFDANGGLDAEPTGPLPGEHVPSGVLREEPAPPKGP